MLISAPAFAQSEALLESVRVHRAGVTADARAELERCVEQKCPNRARLALLTGVLEVSDGNAVEAAKRLATEKPPKGLEAIHGWYLGEAQSYANQRAQAVKTLIKAKKGAPTWLTSRIDRRLAELYLDLGDHAKARALLDADVDLPRSPELLFTRALARESGKLTALAQADWKTLAIRFPAHPHGVFARERLGTTWKPTFEEQLTRARALFDAGDAKGCLTELDALTPSPADVPRVALLKGQALLARGKEKDAEAQAQLAIAAKGSQSVAAQALMTSARRLMRLTDNAGARATFRKLDDLYATDPSADEAGYLAAWLAMNAGELDTAVADFAAYEERHPNSKKRDEARWFRGFSLVRAKKYAQAREVLLSLPVDFPKSSLTPQALYWAARCAQLAGPPADGGTAVDVPLEYRAVLNGFAGTFYGLLASERLQELGAAAPPLFTVPPKSLTVKRPPGLELAAQLSQTGLFRDAAQEVSRALGTVSSADALTWGHALQALGEFGAAHTLAARYLWGQVYSQRVPEALALMYPRAFKSSVETWAGQHELEPALAWAIMRRESAFAPEVTSIADARGLMQLIPPTARGVTDNLKLPPVDPAELYSPDWNIRLGTWYLRALEKRLGHPTLVAGAYNGGPDAVAKWAKERGQDPLDQWVEGIPYKETRGYVKQVTADLFIYRQLYGYEQKRLSLEVPKPGTGVEF
jgi:soluble lytic murein transglycosylase